MTDDDIKQVLLDQREELSVPPASGRWIPRGVEREFQTALTRQVAKVIMGVRRSGKSVLARLARCRDLLILTRDGTPPPAALVPKGPAVAVRSVWQWLLASS